MKESGILSLKNQAISGVGNSLISRIHTAYIGGKYLHFSHEKASRSKGKKKIEHRDVDRSRTRPAKDCYDEGKDHRVCRTEDV